MQQGVHNADSLLVTGEDLGTVVDTTTVTLQVENPPVVDGTEQLYADGTAIENVTGVSYTVNDYSTGEFDVTNDSGADVAITIDYTLEGHPYAEQFDRDISTAPIAEVEGGSSTLDMDLWSLAQTEIYAAVSYLPQSEWDNQSQFTIWDSPAIESPTFAEYPTQSTVAKAAAPVSAVETGHSLADMDIWNSTQEEKYEFFSFVPKVNWVDESSFGVFDSPAILTPQYATWPTLETSEAQDDAPDSITYGHLGDDMAVWALSDEDRYALFSNVPIENYQPLNESSYSIFRESVILSPEYAKWPTHTLTAFDDLVPTGVRIGTPVEYSVSFTGNIYLVNDPDNPEHPINVGEADVTIESGDSEPQTDTTGFLGNYGVSVPTGGSTTFAVRIEHPALMSKQLVLELAEGDDEHAADHYLAFPSELEVGGGPGVVMG